LYYVGIDQSYTSTGYCIFFNDELIKHGIFSTTEAAHGDIFDRANFIANALSDVCGECGDYVASIEGLSFGQRGNATRDLAGLQFSIINKLRNATQVKDIKIITPRSLKKFATGNGKATKKEMFNVINETDKVIISKYMITKGRYDITDAYHLAKYIK
jgi:Holliday junction resolvasome RuvABC endonuclease subunit